MSENTRICSRLVRKRRRVFIQSFLPGHKATKVVAEELLHTDGGFQKQSLAINTPLGFSSS
jgi:hypothetical protein